MDNCLVCGKSCLESKFGSYCSKDCRDSDLAILGKTFICSCCGNAFKAFSKEYLCINCVQSPEVVNEEAVNFDANLSTFKYSIFEDNIQRILEGADNGDKRNCIHAVNVISRDFDPSILPKIDEMLQVSNEKAKVWLIEIIARMKDRRAINHLRKYVNNPNHEVKAKALEAIDLLQQCS